jgi:hypothetical protein
VRGNLVLLVRLFKRFLLERGFIGNLLDQRWDRFERNDFIGSIFEHDL